MALTSDIKESFSLNVILSLLFFSISSEFRSELNVERIVFLSSMGYSLPFTHMVGVTPTEVRGLVGVVRWNVQLVHRIWLFSIFPLGLHRIESLCYVI